MNAFYDLALRVFVAIVTFWVEILLILVPVSGCTSAALLLFGG